MNLLQSLNDELHCEIEGHFGEPVRDVCVLENCTASQRLCCSYCKFRHHNGHPTQIVSIEDFSSQVLQEGQNLIESLGDKDLLKKLNIQYVSKLDRMISDRIELASAQISGFLEAVYREAKANIQGMDIGIDERALNQCMCELELKVQRATGRPWSHQTNDQIEFMTRIFKGDNCAELLQEQFVLNSNEIQQMDNSFASINNKLERFFKNVIPQIELIFKDGVISPTKQMGKNLQMTNYTPKTNRDKIASIQKIPVPDRFQDHFSPQSPSEWQEPPRGLSQQRNSLGRQNQNQMPLNTMAQGRPLVSSGRSRSVKNQQDYGFVEDEEEMQYSKPKPQQQRTKPFLRNYNTMKSPETPIDRYDAPFQSQSRYDPNSSFRNRKPVEDSDILDQIVLENKQINQKMGMSPYKPYKQKSTPSSIPRNKGINNEDNPEIEQNLDAIYFPKMPPSQRPKDQGNTSPIYERVNGEHEDDFDRLVIPYKNGDPINYQQAPNPYKQKPTLKDKQYPLVPLKSTKQEPAFTPQKKQEPYLMQPAPQVIQPPPQAIQQTPQVIQPAPIIDKKKEPSVIQDQFKPIVDHRLPVPQKMNFQDYKMPVSQTKAPFVSRPPETNPQNIAANKPLPVWTQVNTFPPDFIGVTKLQEIQTKYGFLDIPDISGGQSRLPLHQNTANKTYYDGEWLKGERHGKGSQFMADGQIYQGQFNNGNMHGKGRLLRTTGDIYEGDFVNGVFQGKGVLHFTNSTQYIGDWKENNFDGVGRRTWTSDSYYEGNFVKGVREGQGVFLWSNGSFYQGNFKNNMFEGKGVYQWFSGRQYTGDWKEGKMHGQGRDITDEGNLYQGSFDQDLKQGYGVFTAKNKRYSGQWDKDLPHGDGMMLENGVEKKGIWNQGKLVNYV